MIKTPALTIVAECRNALTGVGAAIALGNQKWKGNCADFVNAPSKIKTMIPCRCGEAITTSPLAMISEICHEPASIPSNTNPASKASPPVPVTSSAWSAFLRASSFS